MEEWRKNLKKKPARYWSRIEIEEIMKEKYIDRNRFYEYSKNKYQQIINRFYYSFVEHKNANYKERSQVRLSYLWLNLRKELKKYIMNTPAVIGMLRYLKLKNYWNMTGIKNYS